MTQRYKYQKQERQRSKRPESQIVSEPEWPRKKRAVNYRSREPQKKFKVLNRQSFKKHETAERQSGNKEAQQKDSRRAKEALSQRTRDLKRHNAAVLQSCKVKKMRIYSSTLPKFCTLSVRQYHSATVPQCHSATVPQCHNATEPQCQTTAVPQSPGVTVPHFQCSTESYRYKYIALLCHSSTASLWHSAVVQLYHNFVGLMKSKFNETERQRGKELKFKYIERQTKSKDSDRDEKSRKTDAKIWNQSKSQSGKTDESTSERGEEMHRITEPKKLIGCSRTKTQTDSSSVLQCYNGNEI